MVSVAPTWFRIGTPFQSEYSPIRPQHFDPNGARHTGITELSGLRMFANPAHSFDGCPEISVSFGRLDIYAGGQIKQPT